MIHSRNTALKGSVKHFTGGGGAKTGYIEPFSASVQMWIKTSPASLRCVLEQEHKSWLSTDSTQEDPSLYN